MFIGRTAAGPRVRGCRLRRREGGSRYGHTPGRPGHAYPVPTGETIGARLPIVLAEILTAGARCATLAWVSGAGYFVWLWLVLVPELWPSSAA